MAARCEYGESQLCTEENIGYKTKDQRNLENPIKPKAFFSKGQINFTKEQIQQKAVTHFNILKYNLEKTHTHP